MPARELELQPEALVSSCVGGVERGELGRSGPVSEVDQRCSYSDVDQSHHWPLASM